MHALLAKTDELLVSALRLLDQDEAALHEALEALPAPIYMTDAGGLVSFFNTACVGFAGRRPAIGKDRWCVTWKLYTESGDFLPHHECPMARAIACGEQIRGVYAVAERPDGTRVVFTPFPTPIRNRDGVLIGAINLLLDVTDIRQIAELQAQAQRCRRLIAGLTDRQTIDALRALTEECDAKAAELEAGLPLLRAPTAL